MQNISFDGKAYVHLPNPVQLRSTDINKNFSGLNLSDSNVSFGGAGGLRRSATIANATSTPLRKPGMFGIQEFVPSSPNVNIPRSRNTFQPSAFNKFSSTRESASTKYHN